MLFQKYKIVDITSELELGNNLESGEILGCMSNINGVINSLKNPTQMEVNKSEWISIIDSDSWNIEEYNIATKNRQDKKRDWIECMGKEKVHENRLKKLDIRISEIQDEINKIQKFRDMNL